MWFKGFLSKRKWLFHSSFVVGDRPFSFFGGLCLFWIQNVCLGEKSLIHNYMQRRNMKKMFPELTLVNINIIIFTSSAKLLPKTCELQGSSSPLTLQGDLTVSVCRFCSGICYSQILFPAFLMNYHAVLVNSQVCRDSSSNHCLSWILLLHKLSAFQGGQHPPPFPTDLSPLSMWTTNFMDIKIWAF